MIEFVGGPKDGERLALEYRPPEYYVLLAPPPCTIIEDEAELLKPIPLRRGVYVPDRRDPRYLNWDGER